MSEHPFLSPDWIVAVREIRDEYRDQVSEHRDQVSEATVEIRANLTITETPFDDDAVHGHVDTTTGALSIDEGHLDEHDFHVELSYSLAVRLFVERDPQAVLPALLGGGVKLTGDSAKIMQLAGVAGQGSAEAESEALALMREVIARIDAITAPHD